MIGICSTPVRGFEPRSRASEALMLSRLHHAGMQDSGFFSQKSFKVPSAYTPMMRLENDSMVRPQVGVGIVLVFILVLAGIGWAATSGPSFFGHTSDQVKLVVTPVVQYCTGSPSPNCRATCTQTPGTETVAFSGSCVSDSPVAWSFFGSGSANILNDSWDCTNNSHGAGDTLVAIAICVKGGKDSP